MVTRSVDYTIDDDSQQVEICVFVKEDETFTVRDLINELLNGNKDILDYELLSLDIAVKENVD